MLLFNNFMKKRPLAGVLSARVAIILIATASVVHAAEPTLTYTVQPTDRLIILSNEMLVSPQAWNEIAKLNQLKNANLIYPGQTLQIPLRLLKKREAPTKIVSVQGDVQLAGQPATVGQAVPTGAQLQTAANSSAVIELADNSRVKVLPSSVAQVVTSDQYAMRSAGSASTPWFSGLIRLAQGALEAFATPGTKRATPLQIQTPTSVVGVRGTEFRVAFDDPATKNARTEVITGLVRADNPAQGSGADLPKGTGAVISPAQREVKAVQLLPAPDLSASAAEINRSDVSANWSLPTLTSVGSGAQAWRVQVASDETFNQIVRDLRVSGNQIDLGTLTNGNWHARVRGIDAQGLEGFNAVKLVTIKDNPQWPRMVSLNASIRYVNGDTVLTIHRASDAPSEIVASLTSDAAQQQNLRRIPFSGDSLNLGALKPEQRVFLVFSSGNNSQRSEVLQLDIPSNWGRTVTTMISALHNAL
jgi:hypothetical protein